jgi:hypothetical protein
VGPAEPGESPSGRRPGGLTENPGVITSTLLSGVIAVAVAAAEWAGSGKALVSPTGILWSLVTLLGVVAMLLGFGLEPSPSVPDCNHLAGSHTAWCLLDPGSRPTAEAGCAVEGLRLVADVAVAAWAIGRVDGWSDRLTSWDGSVEGPEAGLVHQQDGRRPTAFVVASPPFSSSSTGTRSSWSITACR